MDANYLVHQQDTALIRFQINVHLARLNSDEHSANWRLASARFLPDGVEVVL
jgi:hypothetical protein